MFSYLTLASRKDCPFLRLGSFRVTSQSDSGAGSDGPCQAWQAETKQPRHLGTGYAGISMWRAEGGQVMSWESQGPAVQSQ